MVIDYQQGKDGNLHGYFGNLQARKGWDRPFTINKIKENREIMIWDEVMWYTYVDPSEIKLVNDKVGEKESAPTRFKGTRV